MTTSALFRVLIVLVYWKVLVDSFYLLIHIQIAPLRFGMDLIYGSNFIPQVIMDVITFEMCPLNVIFDLVIFYEETIYDADSPHRVQ